MILRSDTVKDENGLPVPGASVYVYDITGADAVLTSDGTASLAQPIVTDEFGGYSYYADTGYYSEDIWYGGRRRWREHNIAIGNPGSDLALRSDMAATTGASLVGANDGSSGSVFTTVAGFIAKLLGSAGASIVGFVSGLSGAVTRTVQDRLRETVSIKDFGAKGDGTTDDTAALTSALASGRDVFLPAGNYIISPAVFTGLPSLRVCGAGRDVTRITLASTGTALTFSNCQWLELGGFTLEASGVDQSLANSIGIQLDTGTCNAIIHDFIVRGFSLDGIRQVGTSDSPLSGNTLKDGYVLGCGRNQLYGNYNNDFTVDNIQTGSLPGITHAAFGVLLDSCGEGSIANLKAWENQVGYKALNSNRIRHIALRISQSDHENVWIEGGADHKFDVNTAVYSASQTANGTYDNFYAKGTARLALLGEVGTWDATYSKWSINLDTGCDDATLKCHQISGFDATTAGPIRIASDILRLSSDIATQLNGAAVAAAATVYLSGGGAQTAEGASARQCHTQLTPLTLIAAAVVAPGTGKNFTYTLRKNGLDTGVTVQISGSAQTARISTIAPSLTFDVGDWYSVKLVTDSGASVTDHRATLIMAEI